MSDAERVHRRVDEGDLYHLSPNNPAATLFIGLQRACAKGGQENEGHLVAVLKRCAAEGDGSFDARKDGGWLQGDVRRREGRRW